MRKHPHRVSTNPPTVPGLFLLLLLLFLPFGFVPGFAIWTALPFLWLVTEQVMEALLVRPTDAARSLQNFCIRWATCQRPGTSLSDRHPFSRGFATPQSGAIVSGEVNYCPPLSAGP